MSSDRELLELAAKAAGIQLYVWGTKGAENFANMCAKHHAKNWNPLNDDGDALRLAVKLALNIAPSIFDVDVFPESGECITEMWVGPDRDAITRRAIVRAAAEIGKEMP